MANELIVEMKVENKEAIRSTNEFNEVMTIVDRTLKTTTYSLKVFNQAEEKVVDKTQEMLDLWGVSNKAMEKLAKTNSTLADAVSKSGDQFATFSKKGRLALKSVDDQIQKYKDLGEQVPPELQKVRKEIVSSSMAMRGFSIAGKMGQMMTKFAENAKALAGPLMELGGVSQRTQGQVNGMLGGVAEMGSGITQLLTNPIQGVAGIIKGGISLISNAVQMYHDRVVRNAVDEQRKLIDISDEMEDKIVEVADKTGDVHSATSLLMADIIKGAQINKSNFAHYVNRTGEILDDYNDRNLDLGQTQKAMGDSFNAILSEAQRLGTEGSAEMVAFIKKVENSGIHVAEVMEYVNQKLLASTTAVNDYMNAFNLESLSREIGDLNKQLEQSNNSHLQELELRRKIAQKEEELSQAAKEAQKDFALMYAIIGQQFQGMMDGGADFTDSVKKMSDQLINIGDIARQTGQGLSGPLKEAVDLAYFMEANKNVEAGIINMTDSLKYLNQAGIVTSDVFTQFSEHAVGTFEKLIANGATEKQALQMLKPELEQLNLLSEKYSGSLSQQAQLILSKEKNLNSFWDKAKMYLKSFIDGIPILSGLIEPLSSIC